MFPGIGEDNTPNPGKVTRLRIAVTALALLSASRAAAQQPDTLWGIRSRWRLAEPLVLEVPAAFAGAGRLAWPRRLPAELARAWEDSLRRRLAARAARRRGAALRGDSALLAVPPSAGFARGQPLPERGEAGPLFRRQLADLDFQMSALLEMRFERLRNLRCTAGDASQLGSGCRGGFTPPRIDPQFNVRTGGVVGQRLNVNVDYDTEREFDASNNIQVFYQGLEDEILRRVQVGNVTFSAPGSRFITGGIPSNNFGVQAEAQLGGLELSGIFAQQKGNVVRGRTFTIGDRTLQPVEREVADRDFEPERFFFVVDPATLPGYPAVDVLALGEQALPAATRVTEARLYRRRSTLGGSTTGQNLTGIEAVAIRPDSPQRAGPFAWELLLEGRDYYLDPSGLWFVMASRLAADDFLAASYVTAAGDTVGTFPADAAAGRTDTLFLLHEPRRGPEVPTFRHEMRNAYRVGGSDDVQRTSTRLTVLVAESERPGAGAATFLALLGLALETDATTFDEYNRLFPRQRDPVGTALRDYFVVFPHLTPLADSARLAPQFRNDSLYRTPTDILRTQGPTPLYQLRLRYDAQGGDDRSILSLGGFQIREGSERITAGGRLLARQTHYIINYEIGQVTFLNPDSLFGQPTQVTVQYEENQAFAIAPTSILGLQGRYDLGDHGTVTALGLLQRERTTFTRPPLGFEPASSFVGGIAGSFRFEPARLTRLLDALPLVRTEAPSQVTLDVELATSRPSPNVVGAAYVETFEAEAGTFLPLDEDLWEPGSRPSSALGVPAAVLDPIIGFADADAVALTWQNLVAGAGNAVLQFRAQDIDPSIRLQGAGQQNERVLWLALHPDTLGGLTDPRTLAPRWFLPHAPGPRWRAATLPLSATGVDLTRTEFLEVWMLEDPARRAKSAGVRLVLDLGTVFEDAVAFQPTAMTRPAPGDTVFTGRRRAGEGRLDTERDSLTASFNATINDVGIHGDVADSLFDVTADSTVRNLPLCRSELGQGLVVYDWGSLLAGCTRGNGRVDSEDLNNDQRLDTLVAAAQEHHVRFVVAVGDDRYFVRDGGVAPGVGQWRLYRIPFRLDTVQVGLPNLRQVRALRMTVIAPDAGVASESTLTFALARMKLVGAPWVKRAGTPLAGLAGASGQPHGEVVASVISTENRTDLGYEPPPGVTDQGASQGGGFQIGAQQINERSLRLLGADVRAGERAEAFLRFPEGERNFLGYRQLRVWARGRGPGWDTGELQAYVKVAQDENNFYLYRAPARTTTWEPEMVVDFRMWLTLRAQIETRFLRGEAPSGAAACGGDTLAWVACSGPYVVHVRNPGVAPPNLTRVQELAVGFLRDSGVAVDTAELWVDDIRLTDVVDDAGFAGAVSLRVSAADLADVTVQLARRDGNFRQLGEDPSYVATNELAVTTAVRLERLGLERLGITAPLLFRADRSGEDPTYLNRTDVVAAGLEGLRQPRTSSTAYSLQVRRARRGTLWWQRALVDNLSFSASLATGSGATALSRSTSRVSDVRGEFLAAPGAVTVATLPRFLRRALEGLPGFLRRWELVRGLTEGRVRLTPSTLQLSTGVARSSGDRFTFRAPIATPFDTAPPVAATTAVLRSAARVELRPFPSLSAGLDLASDRDLKDYGDSTTVGAVAGQSRRELLGLGVGFERLRTLSSRLLWSPPVAGWLRPRVQWQASFAINRDPNTTEPERELGDSAGAFRVPTTFSATRSADLTAAVDLPRALRGLFGDSSGLRRAFEVVSQLDLGRRYERRASYARAGFDPDLAFQLGLGGMDRFRRLEGRNAQSALASVQDRFSAAFRLPLGLSLTTAYATREGSLWSARGDGLQVQGTSETDWPNLTGRWLFTPPAGAVRRVITSASASATVRRRESVAELPRPQQQEQAVRTTQLTRSTPVTHSVTWAPRITTNLGWSVERAQAERPGAITENVREQASADVSFAFRVPPEIAPLRSDVRTTLRWASSTSETCIRRALEEPCTPISESRRREYNLALDTDMPPNVTAGLSAGYVLTDDRHVNRKFSQFTLTASVRINFTAGEAR